jgi:hypothetical protein
MQRNGFAPRQRSGCGEIASTPHWRSGSRSTRVGISTPHWQASAHAGVTQLLRRSGRSKKTFLVEGVRLALDYTWFET